jgi:HEAT repeat protein
MLSWSRNTFVVATISFTVVLASCGKNDSSSGGAKPATNVQPNQTQHQEHHSYEIETVINGVRCTTGKQEFNSHDSYCNGLQDETLNQSCGLSGRYDLFLVDCRDYTWAPKASKPATQPQQPPASELPAQNSYRNRPQAPEFLVIEKVEKDSSKFTPANTVILNQLAQGYIDCGMTASAPSCLDGEFIPTSQYPDYIELNNSQLLVSTFTNKNQSFKFIAALEFAPVNNGQSQISSRVKVAIVDQSVSPQQIRKDFIDGKMYPAIQLVVADKAIEVMKRELAHHWDYKQVYHYSDLLLKKESSAGTKKFVQSILDQQYSSIVGSGVLAYQRDLIELVRSNFAHSSLLISISNSLINSNDERISRIAGVTLGQENQKSDRIKKVVREALGDSDWTLRQEAVRALTKIRDNADDENKILMMIDDSVSDVQDAAVSAAGGIKLGSQNMSTLLSLTESSSWVTRQHAVKLLGRIQTSSSDQKLIEQIADPVSDVADSALEQIKKRSLNESHLPTLGKQLESSSWVVRLNAVNLIAQIQDEKAGAALIPMLSDSVSDVSDTAQAQLQKRTIYDTYVPAFRGLLQNSSWVTRLMAAKQLGRLKSGESTSALISDLDDSVSDVADAINTLLKGRPFSEAHIAQFITHLGSSSWVTRQTAANLLGNTSSDKALNALIDRIGDESVSDVKDAMTASIKKIKARIGK